MSVRSAEFMQMSQTSIFDFFIFMSKMVKGQIQESRSFFVISFYVKAQFRVYYLGLKGNRVSSVGLRARSVGPVKPLTPFATTLRILIT